MGVPRYNTGEPCIHGHLGERYTKTTQCIVCAKAKRDKGREWHREYARAHYLANKDRHAENARAWKENNRDRLQEYLKRYYAENREAILAKSAKHQRDNKETVNASHYAWRAANMDRVREHNRRWYGNGSGKGPANSAARRHASRRATPPWVPPDAFDHIYAQAAALNHDVDHIVPLNHPDVCGLHVPWNMQTLPPAENRSKGNQLPPENARVAHPTASRIASAAQED